MNAAEWVKFLLNSPGFAALVTAGVAVLAGRHLMEAKDQRIAGLQETHALTLKALQDAHSEALRAKDDRIEMLERRSPAKLQEDVEAMTALLQSRSTQLQEELAQTRASMEEDRRLSTTQRAALEDRLSVREQELNDVRKALDAAREASASLITVVRQTAASRAEEIIALAIDSLIRSLSPRYVQPSGGAFRINGRRFLADTVLQATDTSPDLIVEVKYATSNRGIANQLRDAVPRLDLACDAYENSTHRRSVGLLVFVLSTDITSTDEATVRAFELLGKGFREFSVGLRASILLLDLTETALRRVEAGELRGRLDSMLEAFAPTGDERR